MTSIDHDPAEKYEIDELHYAEASTPADGADELHRSLKRDLRMRHMIMIAISGTIGTGLFLTSGHVIALAGPGGALVAYFLASIWLVFVLQAIGEIGTLLPLPGAFNSWGARVFDEALSFTMSWMYFINGALAVPAELAAAALIFQFWLPADSTFPVWIVPLIIIVLMLVVNLTGVKTYGEIEYWLSFLKIFTIIMFIICGILVDAGVIGGVRYGMDAWHVEGAPFKGNFLSFVTAMVMVGYTFGGSELLSITASESRNPHKHVPKAVNMVFIRIGLFYIVSIFLLGSIVANNDPLLVNADGSAAGAPFTIIFARAGINAAADFMNAVVFTSIISALNSYFYAVTRLLFSLSRNGWAHKSFSYTNSRGVPLGALAIVTAFSSLSLVTIFVGSGVVFQWLVSLVGPIIFQSWIMIIFLHFRFRYCWKKQGRSVSELPYVSWGYPYGTGLGGLIGVCIIVAALYLSCLNPPHHPGDGAPAEALAAYKIARNSYIRSLLGNWFPWVMGLILFFSYKFIKKTKFIKAEEADLDTGRFIPTESDLKDLEVHGSKWKRAFKYFA